MSAQRERLEAAAANLANANSTRTEEGGPFRRRDVVFRATEIEESWRSVARSRGLETGDPAVGVTTTVEKAAEDAFSLQYKPGHPDADKNGYVKMPAIEPLEETVNMLSATRSFEANATAFNTAKDIARVSLGLGDA